MKSVFTSVAGAFLVVEPSGKGFCSKMYFQGSKRVPAEIVQRKHRTYASVESLVTRYKMHKIELSEEVISACFAVEKAIKQAISK